MSYILCDRIYRYTHIACSVTLHCMPLDTAPPYSISKSMSAPRVVPAKSTPKPKALELRLVLSNMHFFDDWLQS